MYALILIMPEVNWDSWIYGLRSFIIWWNFLAIISSQNYFASLLYFSGLQLPIRETASYCTTTLLNALFFPHFLLCDAVYVISMGLSLNLFIFFFRFVEFTGESTKEFSASHTIQKLFLAFFISYIFHHLLKFPIFSSMLCTFTIVFLTILITINVLVWQFQHETFKFVYFGCLVYYLKHLFLAIVCMSLFLNECWTSCMEQ